MSAPTVNRVYAPLLAKARVTGSRDARVKKVIDLIWDRFSEPMHPATETEGEVHRHPAISWVGIYTKVEGSDEMVLAYCRNKPACSPIGLHGVCGRGWRERACVVVHDVATLGENYIACDANDKSELVVPLLGEDGTCWGVLDVDSHEVGAFNERDAAGMGALMQRFGLTTQRVEDGEVIRL